ncbi:hypothetical protein JM946_13525 [Steroidobacter sp. S1-65]|uniref:Uncharacterized protein n=1 Tax=Steroidobacter gossypii TaxID=2805490 RepID=A0ABS1WXP9_9GAMM|nr:hypothetical protein [Steroidobacter gossypii]MBM0105756.1 hypothetical protein [Steroidobacter gossypii]
MLPLLAGAVVNGAQACQELHLQATETADGARYALAKDVELVFGRDESLDSETDYGQRAMLYRSEGGAVRRTYFSAGAEDSSAMTPSFFTRCGPHELLILADIGNESAWGFRVFAYDGKALRDLGIVPIAVRGEGNMESAIPFVDLTPRGEVIDLTFTTDVIKDPESKQQRPVAGEDVLYQIDATSVRAK